MVTTTQRSALSEVPDPTRSSEPALAWLRAPTVRRLGRVRLPLAGAYRPWATLYRFPDGRTLVLVRLWGTTGPVRRVYDASVVRAWAMAQRLTELAAAIDALAGAR